MLPRRVDTGVETVGQSIVPELPDVCHGKIGSAGDAKVILRDAERAAADEAASWKKEVLQGPKSR